MAQDRIRGWRGLILAALLLAPLAAQAQQPTPIPQPSAFAAVLAQNLATALAENDALRAEVAKLKAEHAPSSTPPKEPNKP